MRHGDHRHFANGLVRHEHVLHIDTADVLAPADDDVLRAVLDLQAVVRVRDGQISCEEVSIAEHLLGRSLVAQVPIGRRNRSFIVRSRLVQKKIR